MIYVLQSKIITKCTFYNYLRNSQECVLSLSTLQFNFISLIFYYLQVQFLKIYFFYIWSTLQVYIQYS